MKLPLSLVLLTLLSYSCQTNNTEDKQVSKSKSGSAAEASVGNFIHLRNAAAIPDSIKKAINTDYGIVMMSNADETQFVTAYQDSAMPAGNFYAFQIEGMSNNVVDWDFPVLQSNLSQFKTTNGIYLNMPLSDLVKIKGEPVTKTTENGVTAYVYFEHESHTKPNEEYAFYCEVVEGKVTNIRSGYVPADGQK